MGLPFISIYGNRVSMRMCIALQKDAEYNNIEDGAVCSLISLLYSDYYQ